MSRPNELFWVSLLLISTQFLQFYNLGGPIELAIGKYGTASASSMELNFIIFYIFFIDSHSFCCDLGELWLLTRKNIDHIYKFRSLLVYRSPWRHKTTSFFSFFIYYITPIHIIVAIFHYNDFFIDFYFAFNLFLFFLLEKKSQFHT